MTQGGSTYLASAAELRKGAGGWAITRLNVTSTWLARQPSGGVATWLTSSDCQTCVANDAYSEFQPNIVSWRIAHQAEGRWDFQNWRMSHADGNWNHQNNERAAYDGSENGGAAGQKIYIWYWRP